MATIGVAQGNVITFRPEKEPRNHAELTAATPRGLRGKVFGFSEASQRRLRRLLFRVRRSDAVFVTLTQRENFSMRDYQACWRRFEVRLRRWFPEVGAVVWRLERQERGALHLHLIIFPKKPNCRLWIPWQWFALYWGRAVGQIGDWWQLAGWPSVRVKRVSYRLDKQYYNYISKYVSKWQPEGAASGASGAAQVATVPTLVERLESLHQGRQLAPVAAPDASLENTHISAHDDDSESGRCWGVTGRQWLTYAQVRLIADVFLSADTIDWLMRMSAWRAEQGYSLTNWSTVVWQRLTH